MIKKIIFANILCMQICLHAQQVLYVKSDAVGSNNGTSWLNAYTGLQTALQAAHYGDQIWVAQGTYTPTSNTDRDQSFMVPVGVSIWGGFLGNESSLHQRDFSGNLTILSGEIGDQNEFSDNSFHVVTILGGDSLTVVDGFKIVQGNADGPDAGGIQSRNYGGGILVVTDQQNTVASPYIRNCKFEKNRGIYGGALSCRGSNNFACIPNISNCTFMNNRAENFGGSIYKEGINAADKPFIIKNCHSTKNYCQQIAGGIAIVRPSGVVRLQGCTFTSDTGRLEVGGLYLETGEAKMKYEIDSCFFDGNYSINGCGGLTQVVTGFYLDSVEVSISNTSFLLNKNLLGAGGGFASYAFAKHQKISLLNCIFSNNFSQNGGGGVWIEGASDCFTDIQTNRCFFFGNLTGVPSGPGSFFYRGFSSLPLKNVTTITNSVFMFNSGAVTCLGGNPAITKTYIVNCSFYRNGHRPFIKYWADDLPPAYRSTMEILNSIIWEPEADGVENVFYNSDPANFTIYDYFVDHSMIHLSNCNFNGFDVCHEGMIYTEWPDFVDSTGQLGLVPWADYPGLNKGSNVIVDTFNISSDFEGNARIYCDSVDIGAYEIPANCSSGTHETGLYQIPASITILKNPVYSGEPINFEIFSIKSMTVDIELQDINGHILWHNHKWIDAGTPELVSITRQAGLPGTYFLRVTDNTGNVYAKKIIVAN